MWLQTNTESNFNYDNVYTLHDMKRDETGLYNNRNHKSKDGILKRELCFQVSTTSAAFTWNVSLFVTRMSKLNYVRNDTFISIV